MSLLNEIRNQSEGVRKAMFALSLIMVLSLVGTMWFRSFQTNLYALLNTDEVPAGEQRQFAGQDEDSSADQTPFAMIGSMFKGLSAQISGLWTTPQGPLPKDENPAPIKSGNARSLPISR